MTPASVMVVLPPTQPRLTAKAAKTLLSILRSHAERHVAADAPAARGMASR
jgi:hypothetical protein